jgi:DNA-binding transcriptional LysR family regulator
MDLTLRQLRYFTATAEAGQVSKAARELNVSQSAITVAVRHVETVVGASLFERHRAGVSLTYEGNLFLENARHILRAYEEALRLPERGSDLNGHLRLATTYTVAGYFLPAMLSRFTQAFPNVRVELVEADRSSIEEGLASGQFDVAVMLTSNIVNEEEVAHETLMRSPRRLWVAAQHPLIEAGRASLGEIAREPYVMLTVDEASNTAQRYWNRSAYRPNTILRTSSVEAVRSMVANGMGVSILSDMVYRPWSLDGRRIEALPVVEPVPTMDVGIAWATNAALSPSVTAFRNFLRLSVVR